MSPVLIGIIGIIVLFVLMAFRMQIGFAMALVAFFGIWIIISSNAAFSKLGLTPFDVAGSYDLSALPLFLLMANVVSVTGLGKDLYNLAAKWLGRMPGGLAMATVGGCAGFAAISSSSLATSLTMGLVAYPEMQKYKYAPSLAAGCIAAGGSLGILIPPSGVLIMYGIITETSIGRLFIGGLVPGILEAVFYMFTIYILCRRNPALGPKGPKSTFMEKIQAIGPCGEILALIALVLGGLMIGWFTPTEAGAVGACGAIVFSLIRKRLDMGKFRQIIVETIKVTGMLYIVMIGAMLFKYFMASSTLPSMLGEFIGGLTMPPLAIMGIIIVFYIFLGCFLDATAMILLTIPIFLPLVDHLGFDLVWFGIIVVRVVEVALITPPVGMVVYNMSAITGQPATTIFKGVFPFIISDIVHIAMLLFIPAVVLFLPNLLM